MSWKTYCRAATTANITIATALNNADTIDGVTLATGDRVLVKDQSTGSQNGIYIVGASPARAWDMDQDGTTSVPAEEVLGAFIHVIDGTTNGGTVWRSTNTTPPTLGTDWLTFAEFATGMGPTPVIAHGSMGATETFTFSAPPVATVSGPVHTGTLNADLTATLSGATSGEFAEWLLILTQDGTGGRTVTWPAAVVDPPVLDETAGTTSAVYFYSTDGGTTIYTGDLVAGAGTSLDTGAAILLDHGTVGATETIDQSAAVAHLITLDVNCTLTFTGAVATVGADDVECAFRLYVIQDGSGGNTITWPGSVVWPGGSAPTLSTTAASVEILDFTTPDGGTTWYGFHGGTLADHDHSASGSQGGATLSPATLNIPATNSPAQTANGQAVWDSDDDVLTVGTGAARRTIGYVGSTTPIIESGSGSAGSSNETSRADHVHPLASSGSRGKLLLESGHAVPFVFDEILQDSDGSDFLYASA